MVENLPVTSATSKDQKDIVFKFNMSTVVTFVIAQIVVFIILMILAKILGRTLANFWSDYLEEPSQFVWRTWFKRIFTLHDTEGLLQLSSTRLGKTRQVYVTQWKEGGEVEGLQELTKARRSSSDSTKSLCF